MSPRAKSILLMVGTLLIGVVLGALLNARLAERRLERLDSLRSERGFVRFIENIVEPRDESQREELREVLRRSGERMQAHREQVGRETRAILDSTRSELEDILTPEQIQRLDDHFRDQQRRWERRRDGRGGGPPRGRGRRGPPPSDSLPQPVD